MKKYLFYIVKYVRWIYSLYFYLGSFALKVLKLFVRPDDRLILFSSFGGRKFDDSPRAIYEAMIRDCRFKEYKFVWAFKIDQEKAHREGYDAKTVRGGVTIDKDYPGCPYCGAKNFYTCGSCGCVVCYHGEEAVTCPKCGFHGEITKVDAIDLRGGGY